MDRPLTLLGIESSCDDTAAAVVRAAPGAAMGRILSSEVAGQATLHADFGGVVPEIAARAHAERLDTVAAVALRGAGVTLGGLDAIAVTAGPGLVGGVLAGVMFAKGLAAARGLPILGINHLAGHALTPRLTDGLGFPYLVLLVSGGHCQFLVGRGRRPVSPVGRHDRRRARRGVRQARQAAGAAAARGPAIETEAEGGDPARFALPRPLLDRPGCDLSFSGLKTAALRARDRAMDGLGGLRRADRRDLCASFQAAVADVLAEKSRRALAAAPGMTAFAVAGGVAANRPIRAALAAVAGRAGVAFVAPPPALCTDNAAMIAWAGIERFRLGHRDDMTLAARPRWPLDPMAAPILGSGRKGAKT